MCRLDKQKPARDSRLKEECSKERIPWNKPITAALTASRK